MKNTTAIFRIFSDGTTRIAQYAVLIGLLAAGYATGEEAAPAKPAEADAKPAVSPTDAMKQMILEKNVFSPARKVSRVNVPLSNPTPPVQELLPRRLKRPFTVKGITQVDETSSAYIYMENPSEYRTVKAGELIETVKILAIEQNSLTCDYAGRKVKIAVNENSDDALQRMLGSTGVSQYYLIGTTVGPEDSFALFSFPGEERPRKMHVNEMLGTSRVISIEAGKVTLLDADGFKITVEPGPPPKR